MEDCDLNGSEFKIAVLEILNALQGESEKQFNKLRNKTDEQKEYFTKDTKTLKSN